MAITTDNASNMVAAVRATAEMVDVDSTPLTSAVELGMSGADDDESQYSELAKRTGMLLDTALHDMKLPHVRCLAHSLNLIVQAGVGHIADIRSKARAIVSFFHRSTIGAENLIDQQKSIYPDSAPLKMIVEVSTRWNSALHMLNRLQQIKTAYIAVMQDLPDIEELTRADFELIEKVVKILNPFELATKELSGEKFVTASKVIVLCERLKESLLKNLLNAGENTIIKNMIETMLKGFDERYPNLQGQKVLCLPTYVDPRFRRSGFLSENKYKYAKGLAENRLRANYRVQEDAPQEAPQATNATSENELWGDFDQQFTQAQASRRPCASLLEIDMYSSEPEIHRNCSPLQWWKNRANQYPALSYLAKRHLAVVATSVPSERVFSTAGQVVSARRSRLTPHNVKKIMFMHYNMRHF